MLQKDFSGVVEIAVEVEGVTLVSHLLPVEFYQNICEALDLHTDEYPNLKRPQSEAVYWKAHARDLAFEQPNTLLPIVCPSKIWILGCYLFS